jgi:hypothetical protein
MRPLTCLSAVALLLTAATPGQAQEKHYVMVFGSQRMPPDPRHSHSFAIFVRQTCTPIGSQLDWHIISWLAASGVVRLNALCPEPGLNHDIPSTFDWAYSSGQRVSMWGPYEIQPFLYQRSLVVFNRVNSGTLRYKAIDTGYNSAKVSNCIHVLANVVEGPRLRVASPGWGETASFAITLRYRPYLIDSCQKHVWLLPPLGLSQYPISHRDLEPPRSGGIWSLLRAVSGREEKVPYPTTVGDELHPLVPGP